VKRESSFRSASRSASVKRARLLLCEQRCISSRINLESGFMAPRLRAKCV
jgi:hypothetical protein